MVHSNFNFDISTFFVRYYFILIPIISITFAFLVFGYLAFQHTDKVEAINFERLSQKYPPNSIYAIRFRSIAAALSQGKRKYQFQYKGKSPITH